MRGLGGPGPDRQARGVGRRRWPAGAANMASTRCCRAPACGICAARAAGLERVPPEPSSSPMPSFTVHEPPNPPADRIDRAECLVFIKDGFSWSAALFAPFWLLAHRLWWPLVGYVALSGAIELVRLAAAFDPGWISLTVAALHLLIGFEADMLRRWTL